MPLSVAAGFSVGAQTCGSMIRKLDVKSGSRCLVTGASSNTSLFALSLLRQHGVETYALTTGLGSFAALGVRGTIRASAPLEDSLSSNEIVRKVMREHGGFDIVIDPFADVYATSMIPLLRHGGKYITCGIHAQVGVTPFHSVDSIVWRDMLAHAITNNVTIFANCLGTEADLDETIRAWRSVADGLPIEAMFQERDSLEFVATTFLRAQVELERRQATAALQQ
jgi:NADPH:quinone reductase-like Zn-dependent oxidoreductase